MSTTTSSSRGVRIAVRITGALVYLAGAGVWFLFSALVSGLRCDDACGAPPYENWRDNPDAWQYGAIGWLGLIGVGLAVFAVIASVVRDRVGIAVFCVHVCLFIANVALLMTGSSAAERTLPAQIVAAILVVAVAGALAVGVRGRAAPRHTG